MKSKNIQLCPSVHSIVSVQCIFVHSMVPSFFVSLNMMHSFKKIPSIKHRFQNNILFPITYQGLYSPGMYFFPVTSLGSSKEHLINLHFKKLHLGHIVGLLKVCGSLFFMLPKGLRMHIVIKLSACQSVHTNNREQ